MKSDVPERWDGGRVLIMPDWAELFQQNGLSTFDAIWQFTENAQVAKNLRRERVTLRFELPALHMETSGSPGPLLLGFYIKRHQRSSWKEYIRPLLHGSRPMLGAAHEWNAIHEFHRYKIPTMTNVAYGRSGSNSFLITAALENMEKLSQRITRPMSRDQLAGLIVRVADVARGMHEAGLHHQDFYLGHLMQHDDASPIHVIDLGRARATSSLSQRWIIKDLAQLNYSARTLPCTSRCRFLKLYLRDASKEQRRQLMAAIIRKTNRIARHTVRNRL